MQTVSTITCPACGKQTTEQMDLNACRYFFRCAECGEELRPLHGDCCVFCSFGDIPCPPQQTGDACCR